MIELPFLRNEETCVNTFFNLSKFERISTFKTLITRILLNNCYQKNKKHSYKNESSVEEITLVKNRLIFQNHMNIKRNILNKELGNVLENALNKIS